MPAVPGSAGARVRVGRGTAGIDQKINLFRPVKARLNMPKSIFFNPKRAKIIKKRVFHGKPKQKTCQNGQKYCFLTKNAPKTHQNDQKTCLFIENVPKTCLNCQNQRFFMENTMFLFLFMPGPFCLCFHVRVLFKTTF